MDLVKLDVIELLRLQAKATEELKRRKIVRTNNNPLGDYTEWLVAKQIKLTLVKNSKAGYDAISDAGVTFQIKGRRITPSNQSRQLSAIRNYDSKDFDWLVAVIFDQNFNILNAYLVPHEVIGEYCPHRDHVNGRVVVMSGPIVNDHRVMEMSDQLRVNKIVQQTHDISAPIDTAKLTSTILTENKSLTKMSIRERAKQWLKLNCPSDISNKLRVSNYYPEKDIWFFTFPASYFDSEMHGFLNIMLQYEGNPEQFYFLKVPFSYFRENQSGFDIRATGEKFDLHISAKKRNWLVCERSNNIGFSQFEQQL
jgi:hypothetical protein